jgi:hypothetical protein
MAYRVGDTFTDYLLLIDESSVPITGATFTAEVTRDPNGATFTPTVTEVEDGSYKVTFALTLVGTWFLQLLYDGTPDQRFTVSVDVDGVSGVAGTVSSQGVSRATLRRDVADVLMDLIELEATGGSTSTFTDPLALLDTDHAFRGAEILITSGANAGDRARVYDSEEDTTTLTLTPALASAIVSGVTAELYNLKSVGFRVDAYHRAINRAIRAAWPNNAVLIEEEIGDAFDRTTGIVEIPEDFTHVSQVWWLDSSSGYWVSVPHALGGQMDAGGWSVRRGSAETDSQWIVAYAGWQLLASRGRKDPEVYALMGQLKNQADVATAKMSMRPWLNDTVAVRI